MNLSTAIQKMEQLLALINEHMDARQQQSGYNRERQDRIIGLYGEVEDIIHQFDGTTSIKLEGALGGEMVHKDYVSAGFLSPQYTYEHQGRTQLVKVISKVRAHLADPGVPEAPASVEQLTRSLRRFRECCQYIRKAPADEAEVQDIVWIMLRAQFDRVDKEEMLPRFGLKGYKPDFGVPDLRTLVEVKYVGPKTEPARIQEEILADVAPYLTGNPNYSGLVVLVYDAAQKILDTRRFVADLRQLDGVSDVIVIAGIGTSSQ